MKKDETEQERFNRIERIIKTMIEDSKIGPTLRKSYDESSDKTLLEDEWELFKKSC